MLQRILDIGSSPETTGVQNIKRRSIIIISLILFLAYSASYGFDLYLKSGALTLYTALFQLLFLPIFYWISKQKMQYAKWGIILNLWLVVICLDLYFGIKAGYHWVYIPIAAVIFTVFEKGSLLVLTLSLNFIIMALLILSHDYIAPSYIDTGDKLNNVQYLLLGQCGIFVAIIIAFYKIYSYQLISIIRHQKIELEERSLEVRDSIIYSSNLQQALLPTGSELSRFSENIFVLFSPRDHVSGDFYWSSTQGNKEFIALGDCTGHGVPGAMVSIIALNILHDIEEQIEIESPAQLLSEMRVRFNARMKKSGLKDGMDISVVMRDKSTGQYIFSAANSAITVVKANETEVIKGTKMPLGNIEIATKEFENVHLNLEANDHIYLYTDGYRDQFGGEKDKKFGAKRFYQVLLECSAHETRRAKEFATRKFKIWKGTAEQIDDVSVIGIKVAKQ